MLPQWVWGESPADKLIWCILESKSAAVVAAVFPNFPKNKRDFLHKNKLDIVRRVRFLTGRRPMRSFSWDSRHHCPMEVAAPVVYRRTPARIQQLELVR